jgi:hypothetical protein
MLCRELGSLTVVHTEGAFRRESPLKHIQLCPVSVGQMQVWPRRRNLGGHNTAFLIPLPALQMEGLILLLWLV